MALIFYTYSKVFKVLWKIDKSIAMDDNDTNSPNNNIANNHNNNNNNNNNGHSKKANLEVNSQNQSTINSSRQSIANINHAQANSGASNSTAKSKMKNQLIARRKAAKMLISVAMMFGLCYLPIHILNILR